MRALRAPLPSHASAARGHAQAKRGCTGEFSSTDDRAISHGVVRCSSFLSATFVLRFVLSEWMFSVAQTACPTDHGCVVLLGFLCHIAAVEDLAARASSRVERNLDKVHQVAYLVWIKLGTPVGLLSALFVGVDLLRLAVVGSGPWCGLVVLTGGCIAAFVCAFVRLMVFFKASLPSCG
ncbi:hypothetical protein BC830DRAFT_1142957 [Chytriomyces sp. MP71]|nr:hypothetical protein BC830DRAFT_1142957 [Chytriomyces sp. MP71]